MKNKTKGRWVEHNNNRYEWKKVALGIVKILKECGIKARVVKIQHRRYKIEELKND